jgi:hypothetical protein
MPHIHDTKNKRQVNVWVTHALSQVIQEDAEKQGTSVSLVVRKLLHQHYANQCPYSDVHYMPTGGGRKYGKKVEKKYVKREPVQPPQPEPAPEQPDIPMPSAPNMSIQP